MDSILMKEKGLSFFLAGFDYDFRKKTRGPEIIKDVNRALDRMGIHPTEIYSGQQVHGHNIGYANGTTGDAFIFGRHFLETDGLITDKPGVALLVKYADCTPIVLYDPKKKILAALHSGWRGTVQRISQKTIEKMEHEFECKKEDILVYLGPSIDRENYEVGSEVYEAFAGFSGRDSFFVPEGDKFHLSMTDANLSLLREAGIKEEHIEVSRISTFMDERLHSARAEGPEYGLNGLIVMMN